MIIIGESAYSESAIRSIEYLQNGWRVTFSAGDSKVVRDEPYTVTVVPARDGFEVWALGTDSLEFERHTVVAFRVQTSTEGKDIGRAEPLLATDIVSSFGRDNCLLVDKAAGMAVGLGFDDVPSPDVEGYCRSIVATWQATPAGQARAKRKASEAQAAA
jgi:hypothetical protein